MISISEQPMRCRTCGNEWWHESETEGDSDTCHSCRFYAAKKKAGANATCLPGCGERHVEGIPVHVDGCPVPAWKAAYWAGAK